MSKKLYMGVGEEIITPLPGGRLFGYRPDFRSESVNDDLTSTAFAFEYGDTTAAIL